MAKKGFLAQKCQKIEILTPQAFFGLKFFFVNFLKKCLKNCSAKIVKKDQVVPDDHFFYGQTDTLVIETYAPCGLKMSSSHNLHHF